MNNSMRRLIHLTLAIGIVVLLGSSQNVIAQWSTNGNNVSNTNSGNVGVGTSSPTWGKLQVNKSIRIDDDSASASGSDTIAAGPNLYIGTTSGGGTLQFNSGGGLDLWLYNASGAGWARTVTFTKTGNVGVGITSPLYSFDVNGGTNSFRAKASTTASNDTIATFENASGIQAIIRANGNVGLGTTAPTAKLHVAGNGYVTGSLTVDGNISAKYQDVAEWVPASHALPAGTVVTLDPTRTNHVEASSKAYDTRVAGVISAQPGIALGTNDEGKVLVATTGRVRIKVDASRGSIQVGDLLVTSDTPGVAMKSQPINVGGVEIHRPGTLIGKALEPLQNGSGEILVLLSLQ